MLDFPRWKIFFIISICILALVTALPNFLSDEVREKTYSFLPSKTINLGLDLQGGSYLLLEVDFDTYLKEQLDMLVEDIRIDLRKSRIGYRGLGIENDAVAMTIRDRARIDEVELIIKKISRDLDVDVDSSGVAIVKYREQALKNMKRSVIAQSIEIVRRRVDETGTREPIIQRQGDNRILLQVPGLENPEHLKNLLGKTAKMTFHLMDDTEPYLSYKKNPAPGMMVLPGDGNNRWYMVKKKVELSGDLLTDSRATFERSRPVVSFRFNNQGGKKFAKITKENVGKPFAIVLDGEVITAPNIQTPITGGSGIITGNFTTQSANDLSLLLRAGALPAPLEIIEERTVGPSLGHDSIEAGKLAAIVGVVLVIICMVVFYGLFGVFSNIALIVNMILILAVLSLFQATLTLPGIAGMVLTMGMAVDANVLIFERIREETRIGRTPFAAIDHGFSQAFKTITDSNITTLIATLLLFIYGSGPVKGFAVTLSVGIICSVFSAILLTRMMIVLWLKKNKPKTISI